MPLCVAFSRGQNYVALIAVQAGRLQDYLDAMSKYRSAVRMKKWVKRPRKQAKSS